MIGTRVAGYLRVSREENDTAASAEEQRAGQKLDCETLALRDGHDAVEWFDDWDRSADEAKAIRRTEFVRLVKAVERDEIAVIYARAMDRLQRSMTTLMRLVSACREHNVRLVTQREGVVLPGPGHEAPSPAGIAFIQMLGMFAEFELNTSKSRAQARVRRQRAENASRVEAGRTDLIQMGQAHYGDRPGESWEAVVEAFKEAGTFIGACRLLIERGIPSRRAHLGQTWEASTVQRIVAHRSPNLLPARAVRGSRTIALHYFTRLLVCPHDDAILTTLPRPNGGCTCICRNGWRAPKGEHPSPYTVPESRVLRWAKAELDQRVGSMTHRHRDGR